MTKNDIINNIAAGTGYSKTECEAVIDTFVEEIKACLIKGEKLLIKGFMSIEVKQKEARKGRNPQTNTVVTFPPTKIIKCQISKLIKDAVNGK
jgi:nucleoid DNA-binding protein